MIYNNNSNFIKTIDFGSVAIRKNFTEGETLDFVEDSEGDLYEIKRDYTTNQIFAVLDDSYKTITMYDQTTGEYYTVKAIPEAN